MMRVITLRRVALFLSSSFCFDPRLRDSLCFLCVNFAAGNKIKTTIFEFCEFTSFIILRLKTNLIWDSQLERKCHKVTLQSCLVPNPKKTDRILPTCLCHQRVLYLENAKLLKLRRRKAVAVASLSFLRIKRNECWLISWWPRSKSTRGNSPLPSMTT